MASFSTPALDLIGVPSSRMLGILPVRSRLQSSLQKASFRQAAARSTTATMPAYLRGDISGSDPSIGKCRKWAIASCSRHELEL